MCFSQKMPEVKVPVTSAPAAPASAPPDMQTDFTDTDVVSEKTRKRSRGKKDKRYDAPGSSNKNPSLNIPSSGGSSTTP
jgi:hypothetical protein